MAQSSAKIQGRQALAARAAVGNALHALPPYPVQVGLQLLRPTQGFHRGVAPGQLAVAQKAVHAAVAGLAEVHRGAVAAAFLAGHEVVAGSMRYLPRAELTNKLVDSMLKR